MPSLFRSEVKCKWSESEINIGLVNVNVDLREGLPSILKKNRLGIIVVTFQFLNIQR